MQGYAVCTVALPCERPEKQTRPATIFSAFSRPTRPNGEQPQQRAPDSNVHQHIAHSALDSSAFKSSMLHPTLTGLAGLPAWKPARMHRTAMTGTH